MQLWTRVGSDRTFSVSEVANSSGFSLGDFRVAVSASTGGSMIGTAPGVLLRVTRWCVRVVAWRTRLSVGFVDVVTGGETCVTPTL